MRHGWTLVTMAGLALASGCSHNNDEYIAKLKAATDAADITLRDAVTLAEAEQVSSAALNAALMVDGDPQFSVRAQAPDQAFRYHIDLQGTVLSANSVELKSGPCGGSISLAQAMEVAEAEAGGEAVAIVPDDDVACAFEIQVLQPDNLWEVKVSQSGEVLESEDSDEDGTPDED